LSRSSPHSKTKNQTEEIFSEEPFLVFSKRQKQKLPGKEHAEGFVVLAGSSISP